MRHAFVHRIGLFGCWTAALVLLIGVGAPTELRSQSRAGVPAGASVRVTTEAGRIVGVWGGQSNDSVTILDAKGRPFRIVAVQAIQAFEIRRGTVGRAGRGALVGLVSGGLGGLAASFAVCHDGGCRSSGGDFAGAAGLMFTVAGGLGGAAAGALIGSLIRVERWEPMLVGDLGRLNFGLRVGF